MTGRTGRDLGPRVLCTLAGAMMLALAAPARGQVDGVWNAASTGLWSTPANWLEGDVPNSGGTATIGAALLSSGTISINTPVTLAGLELTAPRTVTLAPTGPGTLTFDGGGSGATIDVTAGTWSLTTDALLADDLTIINTSGQTFAITSVLSGAGQSVRVEGNSLVSMNRVNTYTGGTTVAGVMAVSSAGSLVGTGLVTIESTGEVRINAAVGSSVSANGVVLDGGTLRMNVANEAIAPLINAASTGGAIALGADNNQALNLSVIDGGVGDGANILLTTSGNRTMSGVLSFAGGAADKTVRLASVGGTLTVSSNLLAANQIERVTVTGGTVRLNGTNTYAGQTLVEAGILDVGAAGALGAGDGTDATGTVVEAGASLRLQSVTLAGEKLTLAGGTLAGTGGTMMSAIVLDGGGAIGGSNMVIRGGVSGTGDLVLGTSGGRVDVMDTALTHDGAITIAGGTVNLLVAGALPDDDLTVDAGTLAITDPGATLQIGTLRMRGGIITQTASTPTLLPDAVELESGELRSAITGSTGVHKTTAGTATMSGPNSFTGQTVIDGGTLIVSNSSGLGAGTNSAADGTTVTGGTLSLQVVTLAGERIVLDGGTLRARGGTSVVNSDIILAGDGVFDGELSGLLDVNGEISGGGDLTIRNQSSQFRLDRAHSYTGHTTISGTGAVNLLHAQGLGDTAEGTTIWGGGLWLNVATAEAITVRGGQLDNMLTTVNHNISGSGGEIRLGGSFATNVLSTIHAVDDGIANIFSDGSADVTLTGGVDGTGDVELGGNLRVVTPLTHSGRLAITSGGVKLDVADAFGGEVWLPNGSVTVNADQHFAKLRFDRGGVTTASGVTVTADEIDLRSALSTINATLAGPALLTKTTLGTVRLANIGAAYDPQIDIEAGTVFVTAQAGLGATGNGVTITSPHHAVLMLDVGATVSDPINLNNSHGFAYSGALLTDEFSPSYANVTGPIDLGSTGSTIGYGIRVQGTIAGGDLTTRAFVSVNSGGHTYTGQTVVDDGTLTLIDSGSLQSTSGVTVQGPVAELVLDNRGTENGNDRIGDAIPIDLRGGTLRYFGRNNTASAETLGHLTLDPGASTVVPVAGSGTGTVDITFAGLTRTAGSTVDIGGGSASNHVRLATAPTLVGGIVGGWATSSADFITYGADGFQDLAAYDTNVNAAGDRGNVLVSASTVLAAAKSANSLKISSGTLDLGGNTLTLTTGGVINAGSITNGQLTAGAANEIIWHNGGTIAASIVDNGSAVALTVSRASYLGSSQFELTGVNTYSGPTAVLGEATLRVRAASAAPVDGDVHVLGGEYEVRLPAAQTLDLGNVVLDLDGYISDNSTPSKIDADAYDVRWGAIDIGLAGSGAMTKSTTADVWLSGDNSAYSGAIAVNDGIVVADSTNALGTGVTTVNAQGRLAIDHAGVAGQVTLSGGTLLSATTNSARLDASVLVSDDSSIVLIDGTSRLGTSRGLEITGAITGGGDLTVRGGGAGATLILSGNNAAFTGDYIVVDAELEINSAAALGAGRAVIGFGSTIDINVANATGRIVLDGGRLEGVGVSTAEVFAGSVDIVSDSWLSHVNGVPIAISGDVTFRDGVRVTKDADDSLSILGNLFVGADTELLLIGGSATLSGAIISNATDASLHIIGPVVPKITATLQANAGQTLTLTVNSTSATVFIEGENESLSGNGSVTNDLVIADGGTVAPGASIGSLHAAAGVEFAGGGVFEVEIGASNGDAGLQWDHLSVADVLTVSADAADRFVIRVLGLDDLLTETPTDPVVEWRIASAALIEGFDAAAFVVDAASLAATPWHGSIFEMRESGGDLILRALQPVTVAVPSPSAVAGAGVGLWMLCGRRGRRRRGR